MEIKNYKPIDKGCLKGRFDVTVPQWGLTLRDCALFEKEGDKWVNFPSRPYKAEDGTTKHYACAFMEKAEKKKFDEACLVAIEKLPKEVATGQVPF